MRDTFSETAEAVLSFRANRDPAVRRMVITMIPTLASYNTAAFTDQVLHKAMAHLLSQLSSSSSSNSSSSTFSSTSSFSSSFSSGGGGGVGTAERDYALIAIGHTATAVGAEMKPFLESVMSHIKARLKDVAAAAQAQAYAEKGAHGAGAAGAGATRRWVSFFFFFHSISSLSTFENLERFLFTDARSYTVARLRHRTRFWLRLASLLPPWARR